MPFLDASPFPFSFHHRSYHTTIKTLTSTTTTIASNTMGQTRGAGVLQAILDQLTTGTAQPCRGDAITSTVAQGPLLQQQLQLQLNPNATIIQCPNLSLKADRDRTMVGSHHLHHQEVAKEYAIKLLSRPMTYVHRWNTAETTSTTMNDTNTILSSYGRTMQQHILASFASLIDRRLQAYTDLLSSLTSLLQEQKRMIQTIGIQISVHSVKSNFQLIHNHTTTTPDDTAAPEKDTITSIINSSSDPIRYNMTMVLHIPDNNNNENVGDKKIVVPVSLSTDGLIKCSYSNDTNDHSLVLQSIKISLNTKDLLDQMIQETTRAVSVIVDVASRCSCPILQLQSPTTTTKRSSSSSMPRSVSYLAMPPPAPIVVNSNRVQQQHHKDQTTTHYYRRSILDGVSKRTTTSTIPTDTTGLHLLCRAAVKEDADDVVVPVVVSPHLVSNTPPRPLVVDDNDDDDNDDDDEEDVSALSFDQCADIVDVCLFDDSFHTNHYDMNTSSSSSSPPAKRIKIEQ